MLKVLETAKDLEPGYWLMRIRHPVGDGAEWGEWRPWVLVMIGGNYPMLYVIDSMGGVGDYVRSEGLNRLIANSEFGIDQYAQFCGPIEPPEGSLGNQS